MAGFLVLTSSTRCATGGVGGQRVFIQTLSTICATRGEGVSQIFQKLWQAVSMQLDMSIMSFSHNIGHT